MWQLLKFVEEVAERLHDQSVRRFNGDETHAWEELLKARANQRLLLLVKDNAHRDQFACCPLKDSAEGNRTNG